MTTLAEQLRQLHARTDEQTRSLPHADAQAARAAALDRARELTENRGTELRLVGPRRELPPPGHTAMRRAGVHP